MVNASPQSGAVAIAAAVLSTAAVLTALPPPALAQQPVRPLPRAGSCPLSYATSGDYCVPSRTGNPRGAIERVGGSCPLGFSSAGNYCLSNPQNRREAIHKTGDACPLGWSSSDATCLRNP